MRVQLTDNKKKFFFIINFILNSTNSLSTLQVNENNWAALQTRKNTFLCYKLKTRLISPHSYITYHTNSMVIGTRRMTTTKDGNFVFPNSHEQKSSSFCRAYLLLPKIDSSNLLHKICVVMRCVHRVYDTDPSSHRDEPRKDTKKTHSLRWPVWHLISSHSCSSSPRSPHGL